MHATAAGRDEVPLAVHVEHAAAVAHRVFSLAVLAAVVALNVAVARVRDSYPGLEIADASVSVAFAGAGVLLLGDPQRRANAAPCLWAAVLSAVGYLSDQGEIPQSPSLLFYVSHAAGTWVVAAIVILLVRYPRPKASGAPERVAIIAACVLTTLTNVLFVAWTNGSLSAYRAALTTLLNVVGGLVTVLVVVVIFRRLVVARGVERRELAPVALGMLAPIPAGLVNVLAPPVALAPETALVLERLVLLLFPLGFLVAAGVRQLHRARVAGLVGSFAEHGLPEQVRDVLRRALRDDTLDVLYWSDELQGYVDGTGSRVALPDPRERLVVHVRDEDARPLAVVNADAALHHHSDVVTAAVAAASMALRNHRLHAALLEQLEAVRNSRQRIVEAGLSERRKVERDLHDGAQQRLLALSMTLAAAKRSTNVAAAGALIDEARAELHLALEELRDLARGIHPAVLSQSGLAAAVESLAERSPAPVVVNVPPDRWPAAVEATAYFVISEALANVAKHAPTAQTKVRVEQEGEVLVVEAVDDGPGGADVRAGTGLLGLRDRVAALGGTLEVESTPVSGTLLRARLPCG